MHAHITLIELQKKKIDHFVESNGILCVGPLVIFRQLKNEDGTEQVTCLVIFRLCFFRPI